MPEGFMGLHGLKLFLQDRYPEGHEAQVLQHDPVTLVGGLPEIVQCLLRLPLAHGDFKQGDAASGGELAQFLGGVRT